MHRKVEIKEKIIIKQKHIQRAKFNNMQKTDISSFQNFLPYFVQFHSIQFNDWKHPSQSKKRSNSQMQIKLLGTVKFQFLCIFVIKTLTVENAEIMLIP